MKYFILFSVATWISFSNAAVVKRAPAINKPLVMRCAQPPYRYQFTVTKVVSNSVHYEELIGRERWVGVKNIWQMGTGLNMKMKSPNLDRSYTIKKGNLADFLNLNIGKKYSGVVEELRKESDQNVLWNYEFHVLGKQKVLTRSFGMQNVYNIREMGTSGIESYTMDLIYSPRLAQVISFRRRFKRDARKSQVEAFRSEEHTSELQSRL